MGIFASCLEKKRRPPRKRTYREKVEKMLRRYPLIKMRIELQNREYYPSCTTRYTEKPITGRGISSPTEKYGILRADNYLEIKPMIEALKILNQNEREVIEQSYFQSDKPDIGLLCQKWGFSERNYYRIKADALEKLAFVLGHKD